MAGNRLKNLVIDEISGVDSAANECDFWLVVKSLEPAQQDAAKAALADAETVFGSLYEALVATKKFMARVPDEISAAASVLEPYCETLLSEDEGSLTPEATAAESEVLKGAAAFGDLPLSDRKLAWDAGAADQRVRAWASSDDSGDKDKIDWPKYRTAFFWNDGTEGFASVKLGFADVIDGKLTAIWRGVAAAAGAMQGSRGGVMMPNADMSSVQGTVAKYYAKAAKDFSDDGIVPPWSAKKWGERIGFFLGLRKREQSNDLMFSPEEAAEAIRSVLKATTPAPVPGKIAWSDEGSYQDMQNEVQEALVDMFPAAGDGNCQLYVNDLTPTQALVCDWSGGAAKYWVISYTIDDASDEATLAPMNEWTEVEQTWIAAD